MSASIKASAYIYLYVLSNNYLLIYVCIIYMYACIGM